MRTSRDEMIDDDAYSIAYNGCPPFPVNKRILELIQVFMGEVLPATSIDSIKVPEVIRAHAYTAFGE